MKRTIFLRVFTFFILASYVFLIFYSVFSNVFPIYKFWFSTLVFLMGILLLTRYICYRIDSNLFSGVLLILIGIWGILNFFFAFNISLVVAGYISCFSLAFISIFIKFRQIFHLKAFVFLSLYVIVLIVYSVQLMPLWLLISLLGIISAILLLLICQSIKSNMRKV